MCSIVGSFDKKKILDLFELNKYRGNKTWSLAFINPNTLDIAVTKHNGSFDSEWFMTMASLTEKDQDEKRYYLLHIQAPTTKTSSLKYIHPAENNNHYLWHNGVIKSQEIERLQQKHNNKTNWDTELLLQDLISNHYIPEVDGGFACILMKKNNFIKIFRTASCPLFIDSDYNISSVKFDDVPLLRPDIIYELDLKNLKTKKIGHFVSKDNPYYFG